jgi:hypothetical protein
MSERNADKTDNQAESGRVTPETSRRKFLTGSAVVLVGVGTGSLAGRSEAAPPACANPSNAARSGILCDHSNNLVPVHHHGGGNEAALSWVIWKAWTVPGYQGQLTNPATTQIMLEAEGVVIPADKKPVVITQSLFETQGYKKNPPQGGISELVFVLPDPPGEGTET